MSRICFINGSPRKKESCGHYLIDEMKKIIKDENEIKEVFVSEVLKEKKFIEDLVFYDKLVIIFPLYIDSIPSGITEFFIESQEILKNKNLKIYAISNCGFLEGEHNEVALKVVKLFADRIGANWGYGLGIGAGEFIRSSKSMPLKFFIKKDIYNALVEFVLNIEDKKETKNDVIVKPKMGKKLFEIFADRYWIGKAKKNGLKKNELNVRVYK